MKNFWLMTMTAMVSSSWSSPMATWLPARQAGSGQPHIMCPIETYISAIKKPSDAIRRRLSAGVSRSASASSCAAAVGAQDAPLSDAP